MGHKLVRKGNYYVYILQSKDGFYYTGFTRDLQDRLHRHNRGRGGRFTSSERPFRLVYYEEYGDRASAMKREEQIKDFSRHKKMILIERFQT